MKIAFITIGFVLLVIGIVIAIAMIKDHLDTKARYKEYREMLAKQKRQAAYDNDPEIQSFRRSYAETQKPGIRYPVFKPKAVTSKPVRQHEDETHAVVDPVEIYDSYLTDTSSDDRVSGWTSTTDSYSSSDYTSSSGYSSGSSSDSGYGSSSSSSDYGSSSSYDSGSSSSSFD